MERVKPRALKKGDVIGFVGPSGALAEPNVVEKSIAFMEELGYRVKLSASAGAEYGYLSGGDDVRAESLNEMFRDEEVRAVVCLRGGYGAMRILDRLDYAAARRDPKILLGYSDITALHSAYGRYAGLCTFHGPISAEWVSGTFDAFSLASMLRALSETEPLGEMYNPDGYPVSCLSPGVAEGRLVGGNLSLVAALCGTPYALDARGAVLLLEDVGEEVYAIDRMLTTLRLAGVFERCAGIVFGQFTDCREGEPPRALTLRQVIEDVVLPAGKPVLSGYMIGHCRTKITVPLGVACRLDAGEGRLEILESALCKGM